MTVDVDEVLAEVEARHRREREAMAELNRRQRDAHRAAKERRKAELPHVPAFEPPNAVPEAGQRYVMSTSRITAWDDASGREIVAATPGDWFREPYARALGLDGPAVELEWRST